MRRLLVLLTVVGCLVVPLKSGQQNYLDEPRAQYDARMKWWNEARFGMFIHWGLYSIPAGEWKGATNHAEWIRTTAQIPLHEYDGLVKQFNPVKFDAAAWVRMAKNAGMKYITITTKHHDGFCLFDSKHTDFDVMSAPFRRDIMKELAEACHREGIKICWYHSIMDWHHPDYLPRREWEKDRPTAGADFERYVQHLKNQLKELLTNYGEIGVLWFDGEWESTWNTKHGTELYNYVRSLQPNIIINNRVGAGRSGMQGFTKPGEFAGDFGTPEQEIPATGMPGLNWETCMTMNGNWGYNSHDTRWKSTEDLVRKLVDIASKGGNFLLNVGPTSEGLFPPEAVERLQQIGTWMQVNGEAVYGTKASPFAQLAWGRCTQRPTPGGARLYLHVFDWPRDGKLAVPGILNQPRTAYLLSDRERKSLPVRRLEDAILIDVPASAPDATSSVVVLDVAGVPDITTPPTISAKFDTFIDALDVSVTSSREKVEVRYTLDGSAPTAASPLATGAVRLTATSTVAARCFRDGKPVSGPISARFTKVRPSPAVSVTAAAAGVEYSQYDGDWNTLPDFSKLTPAKRGVAAAIDLTTRTREEYFAFDFNGFVKVPADGVYAFSTASDDGSRLFLDGQLLVDNDGLHGNKEVAGVVALAAGYHAIRVQFFQKGGGRELVVNVEGPAGAKQVLPPSWLFHSKPKTGTH